MITLAKHHYKILRLSWRACCNICNFSKIRQKMWELKLHKPFPFPKLHPYPPFNLPADQTHLQSHPPTLAYTNTHTHKHTHSVTHSHSHKLTYIHIHTATRPNIQNKTRTYTHRKSNY